MTGEVSVIEEARFDYFYWLTHDSLSLIDISLIAKGVTPSGFSRIGQKFQMLASSCRILSMLLNGARTGELSTYEDGYALPLECFEYLIRKNMNLPTDLIETLELHEEEIKSSLFKKEGLDRARESYLKKGAREREFAVEVALRTLLDLFPGMPKDQLIRLKPVQLYAGGSYFSDRNLKKKITEIEGSKRESGNKSKASKQVALKECPQDWLDSDFIE